MFVVVHVQAHLRPRFHDLDGPAHIMIPTPPHILARAYKSRPSRPSRPHIYLLLSALVQDTSTVAHVAHRKSQSAVIVLLLLLLVGFIMRT